MISSAINPTAAVTFFATSTAVM